MNVENILSVVAIVISILSLVISLYIGHLEEKPYICLKEITFNKEHFKIEKYSEKLPESVKNIINKTKHSISVQKLYGKEYLLVNLMKTEENDMRDVELVLSPMECIYVSRGGYINEMILKHASMTYREKPEEIISQEIRNVEKMVLLDSNEIVIRVAYVHKGSLPTSINYMGLKEEEKNFDYLMDIDKANKYINFGIEKFVFYFNNYKGKKFKREIMLKMDEVKGLTFELK